MRKSPYNEGKFVSRQPLFPLLMKAGLKFVSGRLSIIYKKFTKFYALFFFERCVIKVETIKGRIDNSAKVE